MINLSSVQLRRAAALKDKIESLQNELNRMLGGSSDAIPSRRGPRTMSAAARAKIAAAQRARWARQKGTTGAGKRTMSAAARAKIAAAAKARWAKVKANQK